MKKIATTLATLGILATTANADFIRTEIGGGMWMQEPSGSIINTVNIQNAGSYKDLSNKKSTDLNYLWAYVKHPIPLVPNLRLEYSSIENIGTVSSDGLTSVMQNLKGIKNGDKTFLEIEQYDITPYYNLLDNTFWVSVDVGVDIKVMKVKYSVNHKPQLDVTAPPPMLYVRLRTELPMTGLGVEAIVKYVSINYEGDHTISDMLIKADYTFDIIPIFQPGLEVGYRVMHIESKMDDGDTTSDIDLTFEGIYAGLMVRF